MEESQKHWALKALWWFYKDFISWLKGSQLCLCAIGPFRGWTSVPAHGHHRGTVNDPLSLPNGPEILCTGQDILPGYWLMCHSFPSVVSRPGWAVSTRPRLLLPIYLISVSLVSFHLDSPSVFCLTISYLLSSSLTIFSMRWFITNINPF
jgi:hypothetical protein